MTHQHATVVLQPGLGPLDDPAACAADWIGLNGATWAASACAADRRDGMGDATASQVAMEAAAVIAFVGDQMPGTSAELTGECAHLHRLQRGLSQMHLSLLGTVQMQAHGQTCALCDHHELGALAPAGQSDCSAPFFAGTKLPSKKACAQSSFCSPFGAHRITLHSVSQGCAGEGHLANALRCAAPTESPPGSCSRPLAVAPCVSWAVNVVRSTAIVHRGVLGAC